MEAIFITVGKINYEIRLIPNLDDVLHFYNFRYEGFS